MSRRASRIAFALVLVVIGSVIVGTLFFDQLHWLGAICELGVLGLGAFIAATPPPPMTPSAALSPPPVPQPMSAYRGALAAPRTPATTKTSAKRITIAILGAATFTAAAVPFAFHLPRWIEGELVIAAWWAIWSAVLGVVAYRGVALDDDHRPGGRVVDLGGDGVDLDVKPKLSRIFDIASFDGEGCLVAIAVLAVVGVALLGAWLVVELVAPAVFIVAYRGVVRALARAHAAKTHGSALRSGLAGMGWAALYTAPLAAVVGVVHLIASLKAS